MAEKRCGEDGWGYGFQSKNFEKFAQVSSYGFGYDDYQVGFAGPIRMWDKDKFERWREEETKDYKGKMGYVKFGVKGRGEVEGEDMNINKH